MQQVVHHHQYQNHKSLHNHDQTVIHHKILQYLAVLN